MNAPRIASRPTERPRRRSRQQEEGSADADLRRRVHQRKQHLVDPADVLGRDDHAADHSHEEHEAAEEQEAAPEATLGLPEEEREKDDRPDLGDGGTATTVCPKGVEITPASFMIGMITPGPVAARTMPTRKARRGIGAARM